MDEDRCSFWLTVMQMLAVALIFAGFWLAARISNKREKWAKRTAVVLSVLILLGYPLSYGPASSVFILHRPREGGDKSQRVSDKFWSIYQPMRWYEENSGGALRDALVWYRHLWD